MFHVKHSILERLSCICRNQIPYILLHSKGNIVVTFNEDNFSIGRLAKHSEDCKAIYNSLGVCDISPYGFKDPTRDIPFLAEAYSAATGIRISPRELKKSGERIWNLNRVINAREGFSREDDRWPTQWVQNTETPIPLRSGPSYLQDWFGNRVSRQDLVKILDDYYDERDWDIKVGVPTKKKLMELELEEFASIVEPLLSGER